MQTKEIARKSRCSGLFLALELLFHRKLRRCVGKGHKSILKSINKIGGKGT